jgi:hypothetical protein
MDLDNPLPEYPSSGAWTRRRRLTLGLTAVALVAGGGVAISAASADTADPASGTATATATAKAPFRGGLLHSESVTSDGNGGYVTHLTQVGKIESVDAGNLTVVSEDGFKQAWKRTADTVVGGANWSVTKNDDGSWTVRKATEDLATGRQVLVTGTLADGAATAQRIASQPEVDGDLPPMLLKRFGDGQDGAQLKDRLLQRFKGEAGTSVPGMPGPMTGGPGMPGPMTGGPGGEVRKFEFRVGPNGPSPVAPGTAAPEAPESGPSPAAPGTSYSGGGFGSGFAAGSASLT